MNRKQFVGALAGSIAGIQARGAETSARVIDYRGRKAVRLESDALRVTALIEGGHIAEILDKKTVVNPLWTPPWPSLEPSRYDPAKHAATYGAAEDAKLLAGLMGHNLCLDLFGGPSAEEKAAGIGPHGESSVLAYTFSEESGGLSARAVFPAAAMTVERRIRLSGDGSVVRFTEEVENLAGFDRPLAWTQHVTLGPPFLERGVTQFRVTATRSKVFEADAWDGRGGQKPGAEFDWPYCPLARGGTADLRTYTAAPVSAGITTHLMDPGSAHSYFVAWSPRTRVAFGYIWRRSDFPWMARWEENHCRTAPPWNGRTLTCGMEFGASPMPESRRAMVSRGSLFGVPAFRWIGARSRLKAEYCAFLAHSAVLPERIVWDGAGDVTLEPRT